MNTNTGQNASGGTLAEMAKKLKKDLNLMRKNGRKVDESRTFNIIPDFTCHAEGSVLAECGDTKVLCTASVENKLPPHRRGTGGGWLTAEYGMLPRATNTRNPREATKGKASGRTSEIQRLIGRSLRAVVDLNSIGENTIWIDCDVIQADGGTRTAAITGAYVALVMALRKMEAKKKFKQNPLIGQIASVSVGLLEGNAILDLDYSEDSNAEVDLNLVMNDRNEIIEIQGTAEEKSFSREQLNQMLDLGEIGLKQRLEVQLQALGGKLL